ncbi:FABP family protein [uncultured Jatrophihabitans sp.]|uniref:FABP family protein n=1 Tax=uncultured Jatrophihabitans sp. TaxID=1610747 RepID=UPI0035CAEB06
MPDGPDGTDGADAVAVADTDDLRTGVPVHDALLAVLPLVGTWRGTGTGAVPDEDREFRYAQRVEFVHDGRPFLAYSSRSWLVDDAGGLIRLAWRESGFWRLGTGPDDVEVVLASNTGQTLVLTGAAGDQEWQLESTSVVGTPTSVPVDGERRFYAVRGNDLLYATELAPGGHAFVPHLNARLSRT